MSTELRSGRDPAAKGRAVYDSRVTASFQRIQGCVQKSLDAEGGKRAARGVLLGYHFQSPFTLRVMSFASVKSLVDDDLHEVDRSHSHAPRQRRRADQSDCRHRRQRRKTPTSAGRAGRRTCLRGHDRRHAEAAAIIEFIHTARCCTTTSSTARADPPRPRHRQRSVGQTRLACWSATTCIRARSR